MKVYRTRWKIPARRNGSVVTSLSIHIIILFLLVVCVFFFLRGKLHLQLPTARLSRKLQATWFPYLSVK